MTSRDGFDRHVSEGLHADAEHRVPEHLDAVLWRTRLASSRKATSNRPCRLFSMLLAQYPPSDKLCVARTPTRVRGLRDPLTSVTVALAVSRVAHGLSTVADRS